MFVHTQENQDAMAACLIIWTNEGSKLASDILSIQDKDKVFIANDTESLDLALSKTSIHSHCVVIFDVLKLEQPAKGIRPERYFELLAFDRAVSGLIAVAPDDLMLRHKEITDRFAHKVDSISTQSELISIVSKCLHQDIDKPGAKIFEFSRSPLTVLVADDNLVNREVIKAMLESSGHKVITAANGSEAIDILFEKSDGLDLAIIDKIMPDHSGTDVIKLFKTVDRRDELPIVMITADDQEETRKEHLGFAIQNFLSKPISQHALMRELSVVIEQRDKRLAAKKDASTNSFIQKPLIDFMKIEAISRLSRDKSLIRSVIRAYVVDGRRDIDTIKQYSTYDYLGMKETLISFCGAAKEIGASAVEEACNNLSQVKPYELNTQNTWQLIEELEASFNESIMALDEWDESVNSPYIKSSKKQMN